MLLTDQRYHLTNIGSGNFLFEPARALDVRDIDRLLESVIMRVSGSDTEKLYYDLALVPLIDPFYYQWLNSLARACQAVNVKMICIHIQPTAALSLINVMDGTPAFATALDVTVGDTNHN